MHRRYLSLGLLICLGLAGCASTPKKPLSLDQLGNFASYPLNDHSYRISYRADQRISFGTAEEITLLKAAQTTVQQGFRYFKVLEDPSNRTQKPPRQAVIYSSPNYYPYYYRRHPLFWPDPFYDVPQVVNIDPVEVSYTIECYKDTKKAPQDAFDAFLILQSLGQKYGVNSSGQVVAPVAAKP